MSSSAPNPAFDPVLLELFRAELQAHAQVLEEGLVEAETLQSPESITPLMRAAHSIKGAARMIDLDRAARLAHAMEDVLAAAQKTGGRLSAEYVDALLRGNDIFLRAAAAAPDTVPAELELEAERMETVIAELAPSLGPPARQPARPARDAATEKDAGLLDLFRAELAAHTRVLLEELAKSETGLSPESLKRLAQAAHSLKVAARMIGLSGVERLANEMEGLLTSAQSGAAALTAHGIEQLWHASGLLARVAEASPGNIPSELERQSETISRLVSELPVLQVTGPHPAPEPPQAALDKSVRVHADSLNRVVGLAGECLVETRRTRPLTAGLERIRQRQTAATAGLEHTLDLLRSGDATTALAELERSLKQFRDARDLVPQFLLDFNDWTRRLEALAGPLYAEAVASRMRPFADGTHGYPRMVRDLARDLGKKVHFEIEGASTPVDREILDHLESPLTHLLRNAIDHGIEAPEKRLAADKPAEGTLTLAAHQVSGMLRITVTDDGAGIHVGALREKIVTAGYAPEAMARDLRDAEVLEFLFLPGFSTARTVTEVSGRGVGLDVVHSAVRAIGGSVRLHSVAGAGTTVELNVPVTLSIVRSLLVEVAGQVYAIPLTRIERLLHLRSEELHVVEDRQFCTAGEQHVGILDARQVLQAAAGRGLASLCVVIISDRLSRYGLAVDRFAGQRDLVVKPLPACLGKVPNISAGAILDEGTPVLILDTDDLVRSMDHLLSQGSVKKVVPRPEPARTRARRRVLVVDDSLTVREVERRLLENHGYEVAVAVDGMDGWNVMQRSSFDLLVTDVDMPRMDGLELVRRVRAAPRTAGLPIVIVSYKDQPEYRIKGMEAGANYYLTKSSFHDESLVGAVRDLIGEA